MRERGADFWNGWMYVLTAVVHLHNVLCSKILALHKGVVNANLPKLILNDSDALPVLRGQDVVQQGLLIMCMVVTMSATKGKLPIRVCTNTYRLAAPQEARKHRNRDESLFFVAGVFRHGAWSCLAWACELYEYVCAHACRWLLVVGLQVPEGGKWGPNRVMGGEVLAKHAAWDPPAWMPPTSRGRGQK